MCVCETLQISYDYVDDENDVDECNVCTLYRENPSSNWIEVYCILSFVFSNEQLGV
jgi:hypothetical protein